MKIIILRLIAPALLLFLRTHVSALDFKPIRQKANPSEGKFYTDLSYSATLANAFTKHSGINVGAFYYFHKDFAFGVVGGFNFIAEPTKIFFNTGGESALASCLDKNYCYKKPVELSDSSTHPYFFTAGLQYKPLYSKMNLASVLDFNYDFYINVLPGLYGTNQYISKSNVLEIQSLSQVKKTSLAFGARLGAGFRVFLFDGYQITLEMTDDLIFLDQNRANLPLKSESGVLKETAIRNLVSFNFGFGMVF